MGKGKGNFVVSLDFELLWGIFDKVDWREKQEYFRNTRKIIPKILELFETKEIACTWATVGMLFNENWDEWSSNIPKVLPEYDDQRLSAYRYGKSIASEKTEEFCFAPDLIRQISLAPRQEIGTHTYSHYYCLEKGQAIDAFRADLGKAKEMAGKINVDLQSLIFPRNQFNQEYLKICEELGITTVRTNPDNWYWKNTQKDSLQQKVYRTGDAYIGPLDKSYPMESSSTEINVVSQKASRLFRPNSKNQFLNQLRLNRIKSEMTFAARNKEIYHLWWHPHNFGYRPEENLRELRLVLDHYERCKAEYGFNSQNMKELTTLING